MTVLLGIVGGVVATYWAGRALHWYGPDQGAGLIASVVGALIVLYVWHLVTRNRAGGRNLDRPAAGDRCQTIKRRQIYTVPGWYSPRDDLVLPQTARPSNGSSFALHGSVTKPEWVAGSA